MNFESSLKQLDDIISKMETGQLSLEDSLKSFEEGIKLARLCQESLKKAEQKVQILSEKNGEMIAESFATELEA